MRGEPGDTGDVNHGRIAAQISHDMVSPHSPGKSDGDPAWTRDAEFAKMAKTVTEETQ